MICPKCGKDSLVVRVLVGQTLVPALVTECMKCRAMFFTRVVVTSDDFTLYNLTEGGDG